MPRSRLSGGSRVTSFSSKKSSPVDGFSSPDTIRSRVVFPQPEGPTNATNSPSFTSRSTPHKAFVPSGKVLVIDRVCVSWAFVYDEAVDRSRKE